MNLLVEDDLQTQRAGRMIGLVDLHVEDTLQTLNVGQMLGLTILLRAISGCRRLGRWLV